MRIGLLQFSPKVGEVFNNAQAAEAVLHRADPKDLDLLVLPEMAFSGYNFKTLQEIKPVLEPTGKGFSSVWAKKTADRYACAVVIGYPEVVEVRGLEIDCYNAAAVWGKNRELLANYRKSFLYYTDETWALEGPTGFYAGDLPDLGRVAMGICMDLNPHKFEAPWNAFEFANHILHREANLVVLSMAWLTREPAETFLENPLDPDLETLRYWIARMEPLLRKEGEEEIIVVFANRSGIEDEVVYAGSSCVLGIHDGEVAVYGLLGRGQQELLVVDTSMPPKAKLITATSRIAEPTKQSKTDEEADDRDDCKGIQHFSDSRPTVE